MDVIQADLRSSGSMQADVPLGAVRFVDANGDLIVRDDEGSRLIAQYLNGAFMGLPTKLDIDLWRGNTRDVNMQLTEDGEAVDISGSVIMFYAAWRDEGRLQKSTEPTEDQSEAATIAKANAAEGRVTISFTGDETLSLPPGRTAQYEVVRLWDGNKVTYLAGFIIAHGGINSDAGA